MLPGDCCLQAKPSRRAERRGARGSSGRRGARSHVLRGSWGRGPSGGENPPATHWVPWDGARRGAGAGKQHQGFGCFFCAEPGHGAAPGPPGVTPQPRGQCPGSCPHSLRFHFPFIPISGGARSRWNGGEGNGFSCCWPLVASASDTTATQGWCRGGNAAPGSAAGSAWGGRDTPQGSVPHRGGPSTMPRAPGSIPVASPGGKGHKNPAAALVPAACPSRTSPFHGAFRWGQRFFKGKKVILSRSPLPLPPCPADPQVHSWHCSGREGREGADPPSMGKMPRLPAGAEVQTARGEEVSGEIPFISSRGFGGHAAGRGGREGEREGKGFVCSRCEAGGWEGAEAALPRGEVGEAMGRMQEVPGSYLALGSIPLPNLGLWVPGGSWSRALLGDTLLEIQPRVREAACGLGAGLGSSPGTGPGPYTAPGVTSAVLSPSLVGQRRSPQHSPAPCRAGSRLASRNRGCG